jgi:S-adenosyl methyltransferase
MSALTMLEPPPLPVGWPVERIHTATAHPARVEDYLLAGKDNYQVDREAAEEILADFPQLRSIAAANRAFLRRAVQALVLDGVTQFLDVGTGLPGHDHPADVIRTLNAGARLVLVDNNPLVLTHAAARLRGPRPERTAVIEADLRAPQTILGHPAVRAVLDLERPVGLLLGFVVHFLADHDHPADHIKTLMDALAPDSALVLSHATAQGQSELAHAAAERYRSADMPVTLRTPAQIARFFDGLTLLEPGVVAQPWWRPDEKPVEDPGLNWGHAGLARKP